MKIFIITFFLSWAIILPTFAQIDNETVEQELTNLSEQLNEFQSKLDSVNHEITELKGSDEDLQYKIHVLDEHKDMLSSKVDSLNERLSSNDSAIADLNDKMSNQKDELTAQIHQNRKHTSKKISTLNKSLSRNTLYWIIAVLLIGILTLISFILLRRKLSRNQSSMFENLKKTRKELEDEALKLDEKLVQLLEKQLNVMDAEKQDDNKEKEDDHSLALKVADEIVRIEKNLDRVDDKKRIKPLNKALERIRANFQANGYEIVSLLNQEYDDRMNIDVINFKPDGNLKEGERVISKVIKPQIKYKGVLIQRGQVDVSQYE